MNYSEAFLGKIIDSLPESIVVIDIQGNIVLVNHGWINFGLDNNVCLQDASWQNLNYLQVCQQASYRGDDFGRKASKGIAEVINNEKDVFHLEYPCNSPTEQRWFMMRAAAFELNGKTHIVISHHDITERKLAEDKVRHLAFSDVLTDIPNRRHFDDFLLTEWRRCERSKQPLSLALIDIDHFKLLNDTYGHQQGDECLIEVANSLKEFANRASDLCCRFGGEEFAMVWGDTGMAQARPLAEKILRQIASLKIPNKNSPIANYLTVSIGLASLHPHQGRDTDTMIGVADDMLYLAKKEGRNRLRAELI